MDEKSTKKTLPITLLLLFVIPISLLMLMFFISTCQNIYEEKNTYIEIYTQCGGLKLTPVFDKDRYVDYGDAYVRTGVSSGNLDEYGFKLELKDFDVTVDGDVIKVTGNCLYTSNTRESKPANPRVFIKVRDGSGKLLSEDEYTFGVNFADTYDLMYFTIQTTK